MLVLHLGRIQNPGRTGVALGQLSLCWRAIDVGRGVLFAGDAARIVRCLTNMSQTLRLFLRVHQTQFLARSENLLDLEDVFGLELTMDALWCHHS